MTEAARVEVSVPVRTFLIADVRGYTRFTVERGDQAAARLAQKFARLARDTVSERGGEVIELRGDEALAVFASSRQALAAAAELQARFADETAADPDLPLHAGIGLDAGEAIPVEGGYRGAALNLAARLCSLAGPGEVLATDTLTNLARKVEGLSYVERGFAQLKGFSDQIRVVEIVAHQPAPSIPAPEAQPEMAVHEQKLPIAGFLGALPDSLLVGREAELAAVISRVEAVAGGTGQLVLMAGEPGAGKTRLAQEATLQMRNRGFLLAAGRCYEPQQALAFYPFLEALSTLYAVVPPDIKARAPKDFPYLGQLLPDEIPMHPVSSGTPDDQQRLFRAATLFLQTVAERTPVAILLDDLHWADQASLDLLQHLARHTRGDRVLLLGTYRDVEVGRQHPLEGALRDLGREGLVSRIEVGRLEETGTAALMAGVMGEEEISDEFAHLIHRRTDGNPFFVQQVMRELVERGDVYREDGHWARKAVEEIEVPESVRSVIGQRLSRLDEGTQELLREAGVLGQTFNFDELQAMSGRPEDELERALEEAGRAAVVKPLEKDDYAFDHALTQQALYAELSPRRKRKLHLAAGEALEALPERKREKRAAELAWHFLQADDAERALTWALRAGDQAESVFAHSEAETQYRTALELARDVGDEQREADSLERLGQTLPVVGRRDEALELLDKAAAIRAGSGDVDGEARVVGQMGYVYAMAAMPEAGIARVRAVLERLERDLDTVSQQRLAGLYVALAHLYFGSGRYEEQLTSSERAIELAIAAGDDRLRGEAENRKGIALHHFHRREEARQAYERSAALAEAVGDLRTVSRAMNNLGVLAEFEGRLGEHIEYRRKALELSERMGDLGGIMFGEASVAHGVWLLGDWGSAEPYLDRALEMAGSLPVSWYSAYPYAVRARLAVHRGHYAEAARFLDQATRVGQQSGDLQVLQIAAEDSACLGLLQGRPEEAVARLESFRRQADPWGDSFWPLLARAYLESDDPEQAAEVSTEGWARLGDKYDSVGRMELLEVTSILALQQGRSDDAVRDLEKALALARRMRYPYGEGRVLYELGRMYSSKGETGRAREGLHEALAIFERLGAKPYAELTKRALEALPSEA